MSIDTAHSIILQFGFSAKELRQLANRINAGDVRKKKRKKVMTANRAEVLFTKSLKNHY
jgi:hypothetical protein